MNPAWRSLTAIVQPGHRIASGQATDSPYPGGSIALQRPHFAARGLDLSACFDGTLNLSIAPHRFEMVAPRYTFRSVDWTPHHPPEHFSFSACQIAIADCAVDAWVYYPHPETKRTHFQDASTIEVLAPWLPSVGYGDRLILHLNPAEIAVLD